MSYIGTLPKELRDLLQHYGNWNKLNNLCKNLLSYEFVIHNIHSERSIRNITTTNLSVLDECNIKYHYTERINSPSQVPLKVYHLWVQLDEQVITDDLLNKIIENTGRCILWPHCTINGRIKAISIEELMQ